MQETWVWSPGWEDPLEKGMAPHSSILAWRIPWTEEPGGLQSMGSQRVGHDWAPNTFTFMCSSDWVGTFPVAQWLIIHLPIQEIRGRSLVGEPRPPHASGQLSPYTTTIDPTCPRIYVVYITRSPYTATKIQHSQKKFFLMKRLKNWERNCEGACIRMVGEYYVCTFTTLSNACWWGRHQG